MPQLLYPLEGTLVPIKQKVQWMFRSENVLPLSRLKPQIVQPTAQSLHYAIPATWLRTEKVKSNLIITYYLLVEVVQLSEQ